MSGTAAASINGIRIHAACSFSRIRPRGQARMRMLTGSGTPAAQAPAFVNRPEWTGRRNSCCHRQGQHVGGVAMNELCQPPRSTRDFGSIPIFVLFCRPSYHFRPVLERSILLPSAADSGRHRGSSVAMAPLLLRRKR